MTHGIDIGTFGVWTALLDAHPTDRGREVVAELDEMGWGCLWRPESAGRDPLVTATLWLDACPRMAVATGIAQTYRSPPADNDGRQQDARRGISRTFPARPRREPCADGRGRARARLLHAAGGHVGVSGCHGQCAVHRPGRRRKTTTGARGPRSKDAALSAEKADGAHPYFTTPEHTAQAREIIGPDKFLAPEQMVVLETEPERARKVARSNMERYLQLPNYTRNLIRLGFTEQDVSEVSDRLVDAIVPWGDVESVVPKIREHVEAGADHVCVQALVDDPTDLPVEDWRLLAEALAS